MATLNESDVHKVVDALGVVDLEVAWPGGWPEASEHALLDAVFSMRTNYGTPSSGVRAWVKAYDEASEGDGNDLSRLAESSDLLDRLRREGAVTNQRAPGGNLKIDAAIQAAGRLSDQGMRSADDFRALDSNGLTKAKKAYVGVKGLGTVTNEYFLMLMGRPGIKADVHIQAFVSCALNGRRVGSQSAHALLSEAARRKDIEDLSALDHAVWKHQRSR